jgi:transcriptional regulator with XRE-family HTH domain
MKPLLMTVKLRNNRLIKLREQLGLNQGQFARKIGMQPQDYNGYENLRHKAWCNSGWKKVALRIAEFHGVSPEYIWPDEVKSVKKNVMNLEMASREVNELLGVEEKVELNELSNNAVKVLSSPVVSDRERLLIEKYMNDENFCLNDGIRDSRLMVDGREKISRQRVSIILHDGLRKMRKEMSE